MHNLQAAIQDYQGSYADEQNLSAKSRKSRRLLMNRITVYFEDKAFDLTNCRGFLDEIRETNSPASMGTYVKDLRAFIRFCFEYEYLLQDFSKKIRMPIIQEKLRNFITESQAKQAILAGTEPVSTDNRYAKKSKEECRIGLLLILFNGTRNSELRRLRTKDFNLDVKIFNVQSKGGSIEQSNIPLNMIEPLRKWLGNKKTGQMFEALEESLRIALHRGCDKLGLPRQRVHDLRHIFTLTRLKRREPLQLVSRALRHKKISTTDKYYSQYMVADIAPTVNNSPEIQKEVNPEMLLDSMEQLLKDFGYTHDPRFKFIRTNRLISIEVIKTYYILHKTN